MGTLLKPSVKSAAHFLAPMKALGISELPAEGSSQWRSEIKFDGYRAIAILNQGRVELWSRNEKPMSYPEVAGPLAALKCTDAVLDGEVIAADAKGRSSFQALQGRDLGERPPITYYVFDLLHLNGKSLTDLPIEKRYALLKSLLKAAAPPILISPVFDADPKKVFEQTRKLGLEGIILKRTGSAYEPGQRSGAWLKIKHVSEQELVIGGFTQPKRSREHFGAILVGYFEGKDLRYAGKVGTGFDALRLRTLYDMFRKLRIKSCPFSDLPMTHVSRYSQGMTKSAMRDVTWLKPSLVAQIKFAEWTQDNLLRQPVFLGLRKDKPAKDVRREAGKAEEPTQRGKRR